MRKVAFLLAALCLFSAGWSGAVEVELDSGEVLNVTVLERREGELLLLHPVLGEVVIPQERVAALREPAPAGGWERRIELGLNGSEGNSRLLNLRLGLFAEEKAPERRWKIQAAYWYGQSEGEVQEEAATAEVRREWLMGPSPWFTFGQARGDYDRFTDYDLRLSASVGVGYAHLQTPELTVKSRYGFGAFREFGSDDQSIEPELVLGGEVDWTVWGQQVFAEGDVFPSLEDPGEYRFLARAEWLVGLMGLKGVDLKLGAEDEYRSRTEGDARHNDLRYYVALTYTF